MVSKKTTVKKQTNNKLRIVVEHAFGPYKSASEAAAMKTRIREKVKKIAFTAVTKTKHGYVMKGKTSYIKAINAPASAVRQHLQAQVPSAKVIVTRV